MSARCDSLKINLDVLAKELRKIDGEAYDHPSLGKVFTYLSKLNEEDQCSVIKVALGHDINFKQLMSHVQSLFVIKKQKDDQGNFCGMGFGEKCISVATWNGHDIPDANQVDPTEICYKGSDGTLRCGHFLDFMEFWMEYNNASFQDFCDCVNKN